MVLLEQKWSDVCVYVHECSTLKRNFNYIKKNKKFQALFEQNYIYLKMKEKIKDYLLWTIYSKNTDTERPISHFIYFKAAIWYTMFWPWDIFSIYQLKFYIFIPGFQSGTFDQWLFYSHSRNQHSPLSHQINRTYCCPGTSTITGTIKKVLKNVKL